MKEKEKKEIRHNIIGNGDIASVLESHSNRLYFASGVSNSQEVREEEYEREKMLLKDQKKKFMRPDGGYVDDLRLVYFSSLSVFYSNTRYAQHKRQMEEIVKYNFPRYTIVRLGNITWGDNPHTLINFLRDKVKKGEPMEIRDTTRYMIDKEEFLHWIDMIPDWDCELNITGQPMTVKEIVKKYVLS